MPNSVDRRSDLLVAVVPLVAGTTVGVLTNGGGRWWYRLLSKPSWTPPNWVFGPVWTVLYLLQGIALVQVLRAGRRAKAGHAAENENRQAFAGPGPQARKHGRVRLALAAFAVQLGLNLGWSVLFFGQKAPRAAAVELAALLATLWATFFAFARVRVTAALLLVPYLAWSSFAGILNVDVVRRNPNA